MAGKSKAGSQQRQHAPPSTDPRFARLQSDPRFLRAKRDDAKVVVDDRFKALLGDSKSADFGVNKRSSKLDRFGRKAQKGSKDEEEMKRLYRLEAKQKQREDDEEEEEGEGSEDDEKESAENDDDRRSPQGGFVDYARGGAELESSSDEDEEEDEEEEDSSEDEESDVEIGTSAALRKERRRQAARQNMSGSESGSEEDDQGSMSAGLQEVDPRALAALDAQAAAAIRKAEASGDAAGEAGPSTSAKKPRKKVKAAEDTVPLGEETKRLAVVNMDWDHVRSLDLYKVFSSLVSPMATRLPGSSLPAASDGKSRHHQASVQVRGTVESVRVYVSKFGQERMKREDIEGPPKDIFKSNADGETTSKRKKKSKRGKGKQRSDDADDDDDDDSDVVFEVDDGAEFDEEALRRYQLERLRYYYAVATFDSPLAARHVYDEIDGTEMERTANIFDLQFVPDDIEFADHQGDDGWRDEARPGIDDGVAYKGVDWSTDALRHSKVRLTWDAPDAERQKVTRRANLTKDQIRDEDFKAYLASDSEASDHDDDDDRAGDRKSAGDAAHRNKMRALLGLDGPESSDGRRGKGKPSSSAFQDAKGSRGGDADEDDESEGQGDMQITFMPGLSEAAARRASGKSAGGANGESEETTLEKYLRKQREKKELRRAAKAGGEEPSIGDDKAAATKVQPKDSDLGFDDPFFASDNEDVDFDAILAREKAGGKSKKGSDTTSKAKGSGKPSTETTAEAADADEASADEDGHHRNHFSMQDIIKAETKSGKKLNRWEKKKAAKAAREAGAAPPRGKASTTQDDFSMNVSDPRFSAVMEDHQYAIDPSHPGYVQTSGMKKLLDEKRKRSSGGIDGSEESRSSSNGNVRKKQKKNGKSNGTDNAGQGGASEMLRNLKAKQQQQQQRRDGISSGKGKQAKA